MNIISSPITGNQWPYSLHEKRTTIQDESGYALQLEEVRFRGLSLMWGCYVNSAPQVVTFHPPRTAVVSHFRLVDTNPDQKARVLGEKQFVVYREPARSYELHLPPTTAQPRRFFELSLSDEFFAQVVTQESRFLTRFSDHSLLPLPDLTFSACMAPAMYALIEQMREAPYQGHLKGIYLEAKAIELFLLQVQQLDGLPTNEPVRLSGLDIECLQAVKSHIDLHYEQPGSLLDLARQVGINQQKLKVGFKTLFNTTVFGYVSEVRMRAAHRLLIDEKLLVNEVADRVGYKHAHHFTAAFKRRYGYLPKALKA